jgi:hypothetical protein
LGPAEASKALKKGYDELYKTINDGLTRVNMMVEVRTKDFNKA